MDSSRLYLQLGFSSTLPDFQRELKELSSVPEIRGRGPPDGPGENRLLQDGGPEAAPARPGEAFRRWGRQGAGGR
ncbi:MAG: hypothetical protein HY717_14920 [Planctomycetes bacterium]|nr:hypothetical protein [Planctomycetota bacterium]